jgi:hypothetical protein
MSINYIKFLKFLCIQGNFHDNIYLHYFFLKIKRINTDCTMFLKFLCNQDNLSGNIYL